MEKEMDEGRKRTLGVIASIFACRKLAALIGTTITWWLEQQNGVKGLQAIAVNYPH
jgi:hypothetical protein